MHHVERTFQRRNATIIVCFVLCVPIFVLDLVTPRGYTDPILYLIPIVIAALLVKSTAQNVALGGTAIALTVVGYFLSPSPLSDISAFDRLLTIFAIVVALVFGHFYTKQNMELERANRSLTERNERLNEAMVVLEGAVEDLRIRTEQLQRSNDDLQQFAYAASHDLRQPLTTVSSFLGLLKDRYEGKVLDEKAGSYIERAMQGSDRMADLIEDLLQYSRVAQSGEGLKTTDMGEVVGLVKMNLAANIEESKAVISHDRLPEIDASPNQMVQVVQNLVANAIKFHGTEEPRVHISAERMNGYWQFCVRDNGIGIDPQDRDKLFKMFSRLHSQEEYDGTGIGLALVKRIVERHGGTVWFESRPGEGSEFFFTVPDAPAARTGDVPDAGLR
jgi:signal transduction histidine kinase